MKRILVFLFPVMLLLFTTGCKKDENTMPVPTPLELTSKAPYLINQSNEFGFNLFRSVAQEEVDANLMLSPLSASVALTMLLNGCGGNTYDQIGEMLGYSGLTQTEINESYRSLTSQLLTVDPEVELCLGNAVWYRNDFAVKAPFLATMQDEFSAHVEGLDFSQPQALEAINGWAGENTNGKIPKVLDQIDPAAVMFLMNALYFKGTWTWQFEKDNTTMKPFTNDIGGITSVETMSGSIPVWAHYDQDFNAIELFYGQSNFSMIIVVPHTTIQDLLSRFDADSWEELTGKFDAKTGDPGETDLLMPKFSFEYEKQLKDNLSALGMIDAFDPGLADLSGISDSDIYVNFVKQNTFVKVDEEGTEAAAVTTVGIYETSAGEPFVINKSFIFAIRERTSNTLLFIGKVMQPE